MHEVKEILTWLSVLNFLLKIVFQVLLYMHNNRIRYKSLTRYMFGFLRYGIM